MNDSKNLFVYSLFTIRIDTALNIIYVKFKENDYFSMYGFCETLFLSVDTFSFNGMEDLKDGFYPS